MPRPSPGAPGLATSSLDDDGWAHVPAALGAEEEYGTATSTTRRTP
ncbi:hypothetical protein [Nonomuraea typhae]|nr:hypothetical protein [Nonomuraea typhae]